MHTIIIILLTIIIIAALLVMLYITLYNKIQFLKLRIEEAEKVIVEEEEKRFELIMNIKPLVEKNTKMDLTVLNNLEKIKKTNISTYDFEKKLTEAIAVIYLIKKDFPKLNEKNEFSEIIRKLEESDTKMNAAKSYYNKNNIKLVTLIKKFPSNIIALIHSIKVQPYYDGKEIFNELDDVINI